MMHWLIPSHMPDQYRIAHPIYLNFTNMRITQLFTWSLLYAMMSGVVSCQTGEPEGVNINFQDFPNAIIPTYTEIPSIDETFPYVIGNVASIPSGYMVYLYDNEYLIGLTDRSFRLVRLTCRKGPGPEEINGISGKFGQMLDSTGDILSVFDPYTSSLHILDSKTGILKKDMRFPDAMSRYHPFNVTRLKNGNYISPRGDFKYGMVSFNPDNNEITEWPVGLKNIDVAHPVENHVNMRAYDYNDKNGIIAEIYGSLPHVITHNEQGEILRILTIENMPREADDSTDFFYDICLTDDFIFLLWGDPSVDPESIILVMTHDGRPAACMKIRPTYTISADIHNNSIITTNPNIDEANIVIYDVAEILTPHS